MANKNLIVNTFGNHGPFIIILNSFEYQRHLWMPLINHLSQEYQVMLIDYDYNNVEIKRSYFSHALQEFIKDRQLHNFVIMSFSYGSLMAVDYAITFPKEINGLVAINAPMVPPYKEEPEDMVLDCQFKYASGNMDYEQKIINYGFNINVSKEEIDLNQMNLLSKNPKIYREMLLEMQSWDLVENLENLRVDTLFITGTKDQIVPPRNSEVLLDHTLFSKRIIIENGCHFIHYKEPDTIREIISKEITWR